MRNSVAFRHSRRSWADNLSARRPSPRIRLIENTQDSRIPLAVQLPALNAEEKRGNDA